jgi:hypothetical protein
VVRFLYVRCDCGSARGPQHYYRGETCPFSGWVAPFVHEALTAAAAVERWGEPLTVESLRRAGLSHEALALVMVAEFASVSMAPEAFGIGSVGEKRYDEPVM